MKLLNSSQTCATWQPSVARFSKDADGVWQSRATFDNWTSGGDWLTITIPMEELRYDFMAKSYYLCNQSDRIITDGSESPYAGFGDKEKGLPFLDYYGEDLVGSLTTKKADFIKGIGIMFGYYNQGNMDNAPLIAVDNLRIVPKNNNGGVYPLIKWGLPERDFYINPILECK